MSLHRSHFERVLRERAIYVLAIFVATRLGHGADHVPRSRVTGGPRQTHFSSVAAHSDVGGTSVRGTLNHCPHVTVEVTPLLAYTFQYVQVHAMSSDPEGDALTFQWTADPLDGRFANPNAVLTGYVCGSEGDKRLSVRVTDARGCAVTRHVKITCVRPTVGALRGRRAL